MNNIKDFESFINEELKPETYWSAADKLEAKGHKKRSDMIRQHVKEMGKNIDPITVTMYGQTYTLGADNIMLDANNPDYKSVAIWFDLSTRIMDDEEEPEDYEGPMLTVIDFFKDKTDRVRNKETKQWSERKIPGWSFEVEGLNIPDRKSAVKILKLLKDWSKTIEDRELATEIDKITANDLYMD